MTIYATVLASAAVIGLFAGASFFMSRQQIALVALLAGLAGIGAALATGAVA